MKLQARNFVVRKPETIDITMFFKKFCIATRTNDTTVSLNQAAFKLITDRLPQSSPLILKALCEIGALAGAHTNSSTFRTKIRVIDSTGCRQCISVVRLNRELLEEPGVPLSF